MLWQESSGGNGETYILQSVVTRIEKGCEEMDELKYYRMSDVVPEEYKNRSVKLVKDHVDWFLEMVRPLMLAEGIHCYRHGFEDALNTTKERAKK